jgi:peptide/nickel transport system substrate-binding protein
MKTLKSLTFLILVAMLVASCEGAPATPTANTAVAPPTTAPSADAATQAAPPTAAPAAEAATPTADTAAAPPTTAPSAGAGPYVNYYFATVDEYKAATGKSIDKFGESPMLAEMVASGKLPPVEERLPKEVAVVRTPEDAANRYGGEMHLIGFMEGAGIFTQFTEDTQKGLLAWDVSYKTYYPNVAKGWKLSEDAKTLTLNLRPGMKWSDGDAFDADDFIFWYEDILKNPDFTPDIDLAYTPGDQLMGLKKIDDYTLEFTFAAPYPRAVERLINTDEIYRPGHFLRQYIPKHNNQAEALAKSEGFDTWQQAVEFHWSYNADPKAPTLNPWILKDLGADSALWVRNPYFWRVDAAGNQLPYIDTLLVSIAADPNSTNPVKVMAGEVDWEIMGLTIEDYPVLKQSEASGAYKAYLWPDTATSTALGFALNYTHKDPVLRTIFNDLRFRQALSLAINREDISQTIFFGKTEPFSAPVGRNWTGFEEWMATYYAEYDVDKANQLLDQIGLQWDAEHQWRLRPDGKPLTILGEQTVDYLSYADSLLQIVATNWADIGVKFEPKFVPGDVLMPRYVANEQDIGIWNSDGGTEPLGHANSPIRLMPPWHHMGSDCCPMSSYPWRQWLDSKGAQGEEPPQQIKELYQLVQEWLNTQAGTPQYTELSNKIIKINVENLYFFGTVSAPPRVVITSDRIGNLPGEDGGFGSEMLRPYLPEVAFIRQ